MKTTNQDKTMQDVNIEYAMRQTQAEKFIYKALIIVTFLTLVAGVERPGLKIWQGRRKNPSVNFYYSTVERRDRAIANAKDSFDRIEALRAERKAIRKAFVPEFAVGDIYVCSWGYDQTNVDFYMVIGTVGKHTAEFIEIAQVVAPDSTTGNGMANYVLPNKEEIVGDPFTKRVGQYGVRISSCQMARQWDGTKMYNSWYA